jgi:hypothetical protein
VYLFIYVNLGNNEEQFYTRNRAENARCELFPSSANGRLIIEARKVKISNIFNSIKNFILIRKTTVIVDLLQLV